MVEQHSSTSFNSFLFGLLLFLTCLICGLYNSSFGHHRRKVIGAVILRRSERTRIKIVPKTNHRNQGIKKIPRTKSFSNKSLKDICTYSSVLFLSNPTIVECVYTTGTEIANRAKLECISRWMMINDQTYQRVQKGLGTRPFLLLSEKKFIALHQVT
ncbi:hypothetical protein HID58_076696 [Brassica napus]|uniref:Uncharacterized protein n=1 Tax=Brassica napus TaxID=3708 RepID=A0ABQ7YN87_BRANA|nr:hypothetical protein HID58_076696 [Brassica napus]